MKTNLESITNLEKKLSIEVPTHLVNEEFGKAFKYLQKEVNIKGFRKGKAPLETIRSVYGDKIKNDVVQNIVQTTYFNALKEHKLTPVSMPKIDFNDIKEDAPFSFTANFEIRPEVKVAKKSGFKVQQEKVEVTDAEINDSLENIRKNQATFETVNEVRAVKNGDFAMIDFAGMIDNAPLENGAAKDHMLEIGSNQFIPGFEEGVVGMKKGDTKDITISFPADYHVESLRAKPVTFKVDLKEIKTKVLPEFTEEVLKKVNATSLDDLKKNIRTELETTKKNASSSNLRDAVIKAFVDANPVEVPKTLLEEQRNALVEDFKNRLKSQGMNDTDFSEYQNKWGSDFDTTAKFMVQSAFLVDQLSEEENLRATDKDVDAKFTEMAAKWGMEKEQIKKFYSERDGIQKLKYQITEDNVYNFLLKNSQVEEVATLAKK